jgi:hypothetical protein
MNLPLGMGGFGIFNFNHISTSAYKASREIFNSFTNPELVVKSQKYYYHEKTYESNNAFLNTLSKSERCELADNSSSIGKIFHRLLPLSPKLKLTDKCISMNIRNRLLYKSNGICRICFAEETHNHFEVCEENHRKKCITLHNNVIDVIATQLIKRGQTVISSPRTEIIKSNKKADILITGDLAFNEVKSAIDVTFASLANKSHIKKINKLNNDDFESENQFGIKAGIEVLKLCEKNKTKEYRKHFKTSFVPLAFLSNGSTSTKNLRWLQTLSYGNEILYQLSSAICKGKIEVVY